MFCRKSSSMDPYHDRQFLVYRGGRGGNTEVKAIFAHLRMAAVMARWLRGPWAVIVCFQHSAPGLGRLRSLPTKISYRWSCIRNGFINSQIITVGSCLHIACLHMGFHQRTFLSVTRH